MARVFLWASHRRWHSIYGRYFVHSETIFRFKYFSVSPIMWAKNSDLILHLVLTCFCLFLIPSCNKNDPDIITSTGDDDDHSAHAAATSLFGGFPVPAISGANGGLIGVVDISSGAGHFSPEQKIGFASLAKRGSSTELVYGGDLTIGNTSIDTIHTNAGVMYLLPNANNPLSTIDVG